MIVTLMTWHKTAQKMGEEKQKKSREQLVCLTITLMTIRTPVFFSTHSLVLGREIFTEYRIR